MRPLLLPARRHPAPVRASEATAQQIVASGASGGTYGDPIDNERGWKRAGSAGREVPWWTTEKARVFSVASYRTNPMAKAIIDTYTSFAVGDSGVKLQVNSAEVEAVAREFWNDPVNRLPANQDLGLRSCLLLGETLREWLEGDVTGVVRYVPRDPMIIEEVMDRYGNPMWPEGLVLRSGGNEELLTVASVDEKTGLRSGEAFWWTPFKAVETDQRSQPFLGPILDWLDAYDTVLSNLIDRTALARFMVAQVTLEGASDTDILAWIKARGGLHIPRSGSIEVTNEKTKWDFKTAETGAYEDSKAASSVLTLVAGGAGLAKHWLAEPEEANRATSHTMAEPVRRRVRGVQRMWIAGNEEQVRYAVDRAVAAGRLPRRVEGKDPRTGQPKQIPAAEAVTVTGPEIAAADAQITAQNLLNLATGLETLVAAGLLTPEAGQVAAQKGWEDFMGIPYQPELDRPDANPDDVAQVVDDAAKKSNLRAV